MSFTYEVDLAKKTPGGTPYLEHVADYVILANAKEVQLPNGRVKYTDNQRCYVQHGKIRATLPKSVEPESLTLEEALELLNAKAAKEAPAKKPAAKKTAGKAATKKTATTDDGEKVAAKKPVKKTVAKKTTAKKPSAKKTAVKKTAAAK